ncbi:tyrosine-protein phosphatase [Nocardioides dongxiaopingii]|uniref:tyrosine-protein phosphatase n=1 Tax=Nocardioides sp. S-1144 TaxID=2582905 RepID=UPI00110EF4E5|nr:tyrosine-protein phosphatase [Nocardioides sp. S-1144]QCW51917.1 tyrosine-protein phosphatase [Nocardioides sp. S-1144]
MTDVASTGPPRLPDLANLRDVGGLPTGDGRRTRSGRLLRSATPFYLDAAQAAVLADEVGVRLRIDLRSRGEVDGATSEHLAAVEHDVLHAPVRSGSSFAVDPTGEEGTGPVEVMTAHYLRFLEHSPDAFEAITRAVATPGRTPALVHCTLGKDRTGVTVALLLSAVGVTDEAIVADYARTEGQNVDLLDRLLGLPGYAERIAALPAEALGAQPATMTAFLAGLQATHGGAAGYLRSVGVEDAVLDALDRQLVEEER